MRPVTVAFRRNRSDEGVRPFTVAFCRNWLDEGVRPVTVVFVVGNSFTCYRLQFMVMAHTE